MCTVPYSNVLLEEVCLFKYHLMAWLAWFPQQPPARGSSEKSEKVRYESESCEMEIISG